jgi:acyl-CoA synthetase (AMP-forming)/AMP-acid ligase II
MFVPLAHGASVAIAAEDARRDPLRLFQAVRAYGVTILDLVPSHWRSCLDALRMLDPRERRSLLENRVRLALSASEPLPAAIPEEWAFALEQSAPFWNMFGHTETCGIVTAGPTAPSEGRAVTVGSPIAGVRVHVLDRAMRPLPLGWAGDIWVGGPTVAAGYWHEPELSASRFVDTPQGTLYDTGDRGRYLPDGRLEFLGRRGLQLKIPNGKLDRVALANSGITSVGRASQPLLGPIPPATPTEAAVADIWRHVLELDDVGADTDFFQSGGHSLAAARVFSRLRAALRVELPWHSIYEAPSLRQFAAAVDSALAVAETGTL